MIARRYVQVLLAVLLVLVPAMVGVLAGSSVESEAAGLPEVTLTYLFGPGGTIIGTSPQVIAYDGSGTAVTAQPNTGYHFESWSDGNLNASRTDTNVQADLTVTATFAIDSYAITVTQTANGTISPGTTSVAHGGSQAFTITPDANYHIAGVTVDGVARALTSPYTFTGVTATHTITATFAIDTYTLTYAALANGTISGTTPQTVAHGASGTAVTAVPATGYHFVSWSAGPTTAARTDASVTASKSVTASFGIDTFALTPSAGANGAISPDAAQTVNYGAGQAFTITPATGYHVTDVLVDGSSVGAVTSYTFTGVTAAHAIGATFAINTYTVTPSAGANGSISPNTTQTVSYGADRAFSITPATGYYVADVLVDGVSVGPLTGYTFKAVSANHSISATFAPGVQTRLSVSVGETTVDYGSSTVVSGLLYDSSDPLHEVGMGDRLVIVQSASSATGPWVDLETPTTSSVAGSVGTCASTVTPTGTSYYRLRFVATSGSGYGGSISFVVRVGVRPVLGTPKVPSSVRAGRSFAVSGTLSPQLPAGQKTVAIKVYRYKNRHWISSGQVWAVNADSDDSSRYGVKIKLTKKGKYRFRAYTAPSSAWDADTTALSRVLTVR